jgi:DNA polymerase IIIc chi subunit
MVLEVNFYRCDETIVKSVAPLLLKVLDENKKTLVIVGSESQIKETDDSLWSYGKNKFIPHVTIFDKDFDFKRQPIVISNKEENINDAEYLVFTTEVSPSFLKNFSRSFYFYDLLNAELAKDLANKYKPIASKFESYGKVDGKWVKTGI